jgi:hypothetical protein
MQGNNFIQKKDMNEVFNISDNAYTYEDAQHICAALDSQLATYDQIESAYNDGAEWCNYGWSENQMAFFPTQKKTWEKLQKTKNKKNSCGRPGVNGGYFENPYVKFGVNCFGKKPKSSNDDWKNQNVISDGEVPKTPEEIELENKIKYWKENSQKLLKINSYNNGKWSEYDKIQ